MEKLTFCAALERNLLLMEFIEIVMKDAYVTNTERVETNQWRDR